MELSLAVLVETFGVRDHHLVLRVLRNRWSSIGAVSYGMYLLHGVVLAGVGSVIPHGTICWFVVAALAKDAVVRLGYWYFEGFFLRLKSRFTQRP